MVYVISKDGKPLMPCENVIARFLLESGRAKVKRKEPFTIKLLYETTTYTQPLTLGVDTGSGTVGFAVANEKSEIIYRSEVILRNDIKHRMKSRRSYRISRRSRKTRYRAIRFLNRKNSKRKGKISPTITSKIHSHIKEIEYIRSILPITRLVFEIGKFDTSAMQNPSLRNPKVIHWGYQRGRNYGFANTKAKVKFRDNYTCQICHGKSKDRKLHVHHIVFKSQGGSDQEENLITLCETCHKQVHNGQLSINLNNKQKKNLEYATHMNIIGSQLLKTYPNAIKTFGDVTAENRMMLNVNKYSHWLDASIIATCGDKPFFVSDIVYIKHCNVNGIHKQRMGRSSNIIIQHHKIMGFLTYDKVEYAGVLCFIKARRLRGNPALMDIYGNNILFSYLPRGKKTPHFSRMKRVSARSYWMIQTKKIKINI